MYTHYVKVEDSTASIAKSVYKHVSQSGCIELQALGDSCINRAVKSATKALGMLMSDDIISSIVVNYGSTEYNDKILPTVRIQLKKA